MATAKKDRMLVQGNEAVGWGAISAGCLHFFGYPITPQNEITEWFARELPKRGGRFIQSESELGSMNMLLGASMTGVRAMTSTSSPGFSLMQESLSHAAGMQLPCVIVNVQRGGPGAGSTQHAQMDYLQATKGGGNGGYKNIVLAPHSVQETADLVQLAFNLADKWRSPSIVLTDAMIGQSWEVLEVRTVDFGPLPEKDWALVGKGFKGGRRNLFMGVPMRREPLLTDFLGPTWLFVQEELARKWQEMERSEVRYETYEAEDAEVLLVAFGYTARVSREALIMARREGLKVGLIRPITLWPFPHDVIRGKAEGGCKFLVVEDNHGQMIEDVSLAVGDRAEVHFLGMLARHNASTSGMILPGRVLQEIRRVMG